jgi:hypothetical protein
MGLKVMKPAQCTHTHQGLSNAIKNAPTISQMLLLQVKTQGH